MAGRSRPSFTKRLKERARQEKQREKAERKQQRKLDKLTPAEEGDATIATSDAEQPPVPDASDALESAVVDN